MTATGTATTTATRRVAMLMVGLRYDGGAEALVRTLIVEFDGLPYEVELFVLREVDAVKAKDFIDRGVAFRSFPAHRLVAPRRFLKLLRAIRAGSFDVIHTNLPSANILGMACAALLRLPVVVTLHNTETKADRHWYQGRLETFMLRRLADRVIAVGSQTADARRKLLGNTPVHVLTNAVANRQAPSADELARLRGDVMTDPSRRLFLTVGRLTEQKAHDDLLRAFAQVSEGRRDVELAIAGRGPLHDELSDQVEQLGLTGSAHLLGMRSDVRELMQAADVFVMSSHWEGLPVALLEAMQAGLPIVATGVGDVPDVLRGGCGTLIEPGDVEGLAKAMCASLDTDSPACGAANRRVVQERYSSAAWAATMMEHYEAAIAAHARP